MGKTNLTRGSIAEKILVIRSEKVLIDADLASFYGVPTKRLNEQVKRNRRRFPGDFVIQLTRAETEEVVAKCDHLSRLRFSRARPYAYTEHGALMAASVLKSHRAVEVSVFVVRAFVWMRRSLTANPTLAQRLSELESRLGQHDRQIRAIVQGIRELASPAPIPEKRRIGFHSDE